jgi:hypothetical protein
MTLMRRLIGLRGSALSRCMRVGHADHAHHLAIGQATDHEFAAGGIGPVRRELPVAVRAVAVGVVEGVGVTRQRDLVGQVVQHRCRSRAGWRACAAPPWRSPGRTSDCVLVVDDLQAQTLVRDVDQDLRAELLEDRAALAIILSRRSFMLGQPLARRSRPRSASSALLTSPFTRITSAPPPGIMLLAHAAVARRSASALQRHA